MIDHIGLSVSDYELSKKFYAQALAPIGYKLLMEVQGHMGFGADEKPDFWLTPAGRTTPLTHVAFLCKNRVQVRAFHEAALAAGGQDNGAPGLRELYHPHYYGAFVLDPDGHNIEAVCHTPEK